MEFIEAKQLLSAWSDGKSWFGTNYNLNIYKGCSHGCIYCDSRSQCYQVDDFDRVRGKENALEILERELMSKRKKGVVGTGAMSDPYNPLEKKYQLTKGSLKLLGKYSFGASLTTKSDLVVRDIELLQQISQYAPAAVHMTITTFDDDLCKKVEQRVSVSSERFKALKTLSEAGIFTGVRLWPILPFINDTEENIKSIVRASAEAGVKYVAPCWGVTLRQNQQLYFYQQLDKLFPGVKEEYIKTYGNSYECKSLRVNELKKVFVSSCKANGILYKMPDIVSAMNRPYEVEQLSFL
ncbi:SPL family radical SAM protein [Alkaliphilus hydrothermalis]|uniref:DNA repair photolyase n=1 Tax=Alkaliphilus hydrothermalis TaxID=1482730 RepID=A0ABS2NLW2_9FIRM|nr:radical SAM protein [Alkaliphilus hydrothermalis]MBM7613918.1 DNA repair photolyase [Alkaliphilus hydrothermalis]